jgi:Protein of unknown function (DUF3617)
MSQNWQWCGGLLAAAFLILAPARADDPPGVLWDSTTQMVMEGLPFSPPPMKLKFCTKAQWTRPPVSNDPSQNCTTSNMNQTETSVTWTMACENPPMTGEGEIHFSGADAYAGEVRLSGEDGNMTMKLSGQKVGGCDNPQ